jgi:hypothetical protein
MIPEEGFKVAEKVEPSGSDTSMVFPAPRVANAPLAFPSSQARMKALPSEPARIVYSPSDE